MPLARPNQKLQDWLTQQWVILFGRRINKKDFTWLLGPFGTSDNIGRDYVKVLAEQEGLVVDETDRHRGLLESIDQLNLRPEQRAALSADVVEFYENTAEYDLRLEVNWNPLFKGFGKLVQLIFSRRINQLNVPIEDLDEASGLSNEIIKLLDPRTEAVRRTIWLRSFKSTGQVVYSGVYEPSVLPSGTTCIKAVFPLPNGNATVLLAPEVGPAGELILKSVGRRFGDSGFYFLLRDNADQMWAKYIPSFKDVLTVSSSDGKITATQVLTLWGMRVLTFRYRIGEHAP